MKADINENEFLKYYKSSIPQDVPPDNEDGDGGISRPKATSPLWIILCILIGLFAGLAGIGYFLFGSAQGTTNVSVAIDGPKELSSGTEALYTITISNKETIPLTETTLIATFPEGFELVYSNEDPKNSKKNYWTLGELGGFQQKVLTLRGKLTGTKDEAKELSVAFQYHQRGLSAEFGANARFQTTMTSSALNLHLSGPSQLALGEEGVYTITYNAFDSYAVKESVELRVTPPEGFRQSDASPKSDHDMIWSAPSLLKAVNRENAMGTITIRGAFAQTDPGVKGFSVSIGKVSAGSYANEQSVSLDTTITPSDLSASILVNGEKSAQPLSRSKPVEMRVPLENTGKSQLTGLTVQLSLESPILDWTAIENPNNGIIKDGTITWTEREFDKLRLLKPGEKTSLALTVRLKKADAGGSDVRTSPLSLSSTLSVRGAALQANDGAVVEKAFATEPIMIKSLINGDTAFTSELLYYDAQGTPLGSGPLPPKVGERTRYRAVWAITNSLHEISNLSITARLPKAVAWLDSSTLDAGTLTFNPKSQTVRWTLNRMPRGVRSLAIHFDLGITPQKGSAGSVLPVLEKIAFSATDTVTKGIISLSAEDETTNLADDSLGQGKGVIGE